MTAKKKVAKKKAGKKKAAKKNAAQESGFNGKLSAYTFVITGTLESFSREEAQAAIEAHGGKVVGSISGKTNCAVVGADPGSKADKAKKLGLMILDEAAFGSLVGAGAGKKSTKKKATKKKVDKKKAATNKTKAVARKTALGGALEILMAERTLGGEEAVDFGVLTISAKASRKKTGGKSKRLTAIGNWIQVESVPVDPKLFKRIKKDRSISHEEFDDLRDEAWGLVGGLEAESSVSILVDDELAATFEIDLSALGSPKGGATTPIKKPHVYFIEAGKSMVRGAELRGSFDAAKLGFFLTTEILPNGSIYSVIVVSYAGDELEYEDSDSRSWDPALIDAKGVDWPFSVEEPEDYDED